MLVQEGRAQLHVLNKVQSHTHYATLCLSQQSFSFDVLQIAQWSRRPLDLADEGSSTHALLTEMELVGADEHELVKSAAKRFRPASQGAAGGDQT